MALRPPNSDAFLEVLLKLRFYYPRYLFHEEHQARARRNSPRVKSVGRLALAKLRTPSEEESSVREKREKFFKSCEEKKENKETT